MHLLKPIALACLPLLCFPCLSQAQALSIHHATHDLVSLQVDATVDQAFRFERMTSGGEWVTEPDLWAGPTTLEVRVHPQETVFFRVVETEIEFDAVKIIVIGDSTTADFRHWDGVSGGWGEKFPDQFNQDALIGIFALPGQSTRTYLDSAWQKQNIRNVNPHFVFVQFGKIDELSSVPEKRTTPEAYRENLIAIVEFIRGFGGSPILVTPLPKREFDPAGNVIPFQPERSQIMIEVAQEVRCAYIDLHTLAMDLYNELGDEGSKDLTIFDNLHLRAPGSEMISKLITDHMPSLLRSYVAEAP